MSLSARRPVIIDTDPGVDDILAILLALASPELDVVAITVSFGNTGVEACFVNVLKLIDIVARHIESHPEDANRFPNFNCSTPIILAKGSSTPLGGSLHTAKYFHGKDGLADITTRHPELAVRQPPTGKVFQNLLISDEDAASVTLRLIAMHPERFITYIALGPLTNFANAFRIDPKVVSERLGRVVCMGGALDAPGNTTPVAEFNFYADPYAVREVLGLDTSLEAPHFPLNRFVLCPLDLTTRHALDLSTYKERVDPLFKDSASPSKEGTKRAIHHFTSSVLERTGEVMRGFGVHALQLHDPLAVWCAIANPAMQDEMANELPQMQKGWSCQSRTFDIERSGELTRGMLVVDRRGSGGTKVGVGANRSQETETRLQMRHGRSVAVVNTTPGSDALVELLLARIWGC